MTPAPIATVLIRELRALRRELDAYATDDEVWRLLPGLPNSAGTLALHAAGNLRHFVGTVLGGGAYVRDREGEFSRRGVSREVLHAELDAAIDVVARVVPTLDVQVLETTFPVPVANRRVRTDEMLVHLAAHLAYHLGQVDYHRRIVTGSGEGIGAVAPSELASAIPIDG